MAADFRAFAEAGRDLAALHLDYETCAEYPLEIVAAPLGALQSHHFRLGERAMRFEDGDKTVLIVNDHVRLAGIPAEAHGYAVNGPHAHRVVHRPLPGHARPRERDRE